jgi:hypothetical protein
MEQKAKDSTQETVESPNQLELWRVFILIIHILLQELDTYVFAISETTQQVRL